MILDCSNKSVIDYSIEEEVTIRSIRYQDGDNLYLRKKERNILINSIDHLIDNYNVIFCRFIEYNDVKILHKKGTAVLECIIIKAVAIMYNQTKKNIWETEEKILNKLKTIFQVDKTLHFEKWIDSCYSTIFNEEIFKILKLQIFILNLIIDNRDITSIDLNQYIKMYIKTSLRSKMLELLIPIYEILKNIGREDMLLTKYYCSTTTITTTTFSNKSLSSPKILPRSLSLTTENLLKPNPWYKRLYNWMINIIQKIRSFTIK